MISRVMPGYNVSGGPPSNETVGRIIRSVFDPRIVGVKG